MPIHFHLSNAVVACLVGTKHFHLSKSLRLFNYCSTRQYSKMKGLVLGIYTQDSKAGNEISEYTKSFKEIDEKSNGKLSVILKATGPFPKSVKQKLLWVPALNESKLDFDCISVVNLGAKDAKDDPNEGVDKKAENVRCAVSEGIAALSSAADFKEIFVDPCDNPKSVAEGALLTTFRDDQFKKQSSCRPKSSVHLYEYSQIPETTISSYKKGAILAECQNFSRKLMNTPANYMTPTIFSTTVSEKLKDTNVKVIVRDVDWIKSMKMGSFLSVANGSEEPPKFLELHYEGAPCSTKCIAFVGKGVTFDSGGISLKQSKSMDEMKADMGGAACVVSSIMAANLLKLKVNVKGFIPLTENLPSGKATKPGDVVIAMNGTTIQVDNTDAEGRLILCDALCYAQQFKPLAVLDMATLTGAIRIALGPAASGVFCNDDNLWELLNKASKITGDRVWRMPLFQIYKQMMTKCDTADLNNVSLDGPYGASCQAAAFLNEFIEKGTKWLHIDIAGVMTCSDKTPYSNKGMSGRPTRTIAQFLEELESCFQE